MALPVVFPFPYPTGLEAYGNGRIPPEQLVLVGPTGYLHKMAALGYNALTFAARVERGIPLTFTYGGLYRRYDQQVSTFIQRHDRVSYATYLLTSPSRRRVWNGEYYRLKPGMAPCAVPGTSNHGVGIAWDMARGTLPSNATSITDADHGWLVGNVARFGFSYESQAERWHIRLVSGDTIPAETWRYFRTVTSPILSVMSPADLAPAIRDAQSKMNITVDGVFGLETYNTVCAWQGYFGQSVTGIIDADLWWFLQA